MQETEESTKTIEIDWLSTVAAVFITIFLIALPFVNPCESEDATACTWNASAQGNGAGRNFTDFYGITLYHP